MSIRPNDREIFSITRLVAEHAAAAPDSLAVKAGAESLTYAELELRSNQLAEHLRSFGVGPDSLVGIYLERSLSAVVSSLAVLKAGAAYLPLDPASPADRLAFMLRDSGVSAVITRSGFTDKLAAGSWNVIQVDADRDRIASYSGRMFDTEAESSHLAYVIYTSGSTGQPKGVEITRAGLENLLEWHLQAFHVTAADRASLLASVGFDAAVWELWPYLAVGASVHIPDEPVRSQVEPLRDWMRESEDHDFFRSDPVGRTFDSARLASDKFNPYLADGSGYAASSSPARIAVYPGE